MAEGRRVAFAAVVAAAVVWFASAELAWPARAYLVLLLAVLPPLAVAQADAMELEALPRIPVYLTSAAALWFLALLGLGAGLASGFGFDGLGLVPLGAGQTAAWTAGALAAAFGVGAAWRAMGVRESPILEKLLPRTPVEKIWFVALSLTAGVCEELVFRGFLVTALTAAAGSEWFAVGLSAAAFGVVHAYQTGAGAARAGLLGLALTIPFLFSGSLIPSMLAHFVYDAVAGLWLADWLLRR